MTAKPSRPPGSRRWLLIASAIAVAVLTAGAVVVAVTGGAGASSASSASADDYLRPGMNKATASLLALDPLRGLGTVTAPSFSLTNEDGAPLSLKEFRGKVAVVTFNDDRCTDLCALLAQDVVAADRDLSARARSRIAFVSINANPYYPTPGDVDAWSTAHDVGSLSNWYYGTGSPKALAATANAFGVPIELHPTTKTVDHGTEIFVIGPNGDEVDLAQFGTEDADTAPFAHGLAVLADDALPTAKRGPVGGSDLASPLSGGSGGSGTGIGGTPSRVTGPALAGGAALSSASDHGAYTVLDFWSSTCTACATQLPASEAEHRALGSAVRFLGVDVDDPAASGRAVAAKYGIDYPVIADTGGKRAARFRVTGLPYTVILSPGGKVLLRHPGVFTQDELDYVLHGLDTALPGQDG